MWSTTQSIVLERHGLPIFRGREDVAGCQDASTSVKNAAFALSSGEWRYEKLARFGSEQSKRVWRASIHTVLPPNTQIKPFPATTAELLSSCCSSPYNGCYNVGAKKEGEKPIFLVSPFMICTYYTQGCRCRCRQTMCVGTNAQL